LGYEINVRGWRADDGVLVATDLQVKPNGTAMYEQSVRRANDALEVAWTGLGIAFIERNRSRQNIGGVVEEGPEVDRLRRILKRIVPPYVSPSELRVRIIESDIWNASAGGNGAIWVYRGLLNDVQSEDELAIVLGHELAHYTHEHQRRNLRNAFLVQLVGVGAAIAIDRIQNPGTYRLLSDAADLALQAWGNGYNRDLEDQADRVGLRYAAQAGFDVSQAVPLWLRRQREGEQDVVSNFFFGTHSRASDRIRNVELELKRNYR
jgi:predicted Zn-dependent protease